MRPVWRVFSCCAKCIAVADISKMPLLPPDLADLAPRPRHLSRVPHQGGNAPRVGDTVPPSSRRATPARVGSVAALRLVSVSKVAGNYLPSNSSAKVLLFSHICKYICIKICSIGEFCVAPFVSLQNTFQYSEFSLYFKYPFPRHTHFCPI